MYVMLASIDCLLPCKLKFSWFFVCWVILDFNLDILNIMYGTWVYLKSSGECWYFCCSRQSTYSGCKFRSPFCELWFQSQFSFQSFSSVILNCLTCAPPNDQSRTWSMVYSIVQFSKPLILCRVRSMHHSPNVNPGFHTPLFGCTHTLYGITLLSSLLLTAALTFLAPWSPSFGPLSRKLGL